MAFYLILLIASCPRPMTRTLVSVGVVGVQHPQIFSKNEFATTNFKGTFRLKMGDTPPRPLTKSKLSFPRKTLPKG